VDDVFTYGASVTESKMTFFGQVRLVAALGTNLLFSIGVIDL